MQSDTVNSVAKDLRLRRTSKNKCVSKASRSQKIKCKQVDCHLNPKWAEAIGGNARGSKQEKVDGSKRSGDNNRLLQNQIPKSYTENEFIYYILQMLHICKKLHRRTQRHTRYWHRLLFYRFLGLIFIKVFLGKRSYGRSFILSSTNVMELGWGWEFSG